MSMTDDQQSFDSERAWQDWLAENHETSAGIWLKIAKKGADAATVSYPEALEAALCFGWIDGQKGPLDDTHWLQRFTPRRARSKWSRINREKAETLIAAGRMRPAGLGEVEAARADGRWDAAYEGQRTAAVPPDLAAALAADPEAEAFFSTLSSANRYAVLYRVGEARRPQTRARRIEKFVAMLAAHQTIHPQPASPSPSPRSRTSSRPG
jgi:uncharacterized protein YdeI (YjbR/CyaY-like superfamily)